MTATACPANVWNHTDGCTCTPNGALTAEALDVDLNTADEQRTVEGLAPVVNDFWDQWQARDTHEPHHAHALSVLGEHLRDASEEDRPGYDMLVMRLDLLLDKPGDTDLAHDLLLQMRRVTRKSNMSVVEDGNGGHTRLADGRPGKTCPDCGNGYATARVLMVHQHQDCTGLDVTRDYSLDRDDYDHDNGTDDKPDDGDFDEDAHDALHNAADAYAAEVNALGRGAQVAFLRAQGVSDDQMRAYIDLDFHDPDEVLDDLVIDTASHAASNAYNDGQDKDFGPLVVRSSLDAGHFKSEEEYEQWIAHPETGPKVWGETITDDDPLAAFINGGSQR
jgi:hypothetical protein